MSMKAATGNASIPNGATMLNVTVADHHARAIG
jgi:hypothetical protein